MNAPTTEAERPPLRPQSPSALLNLEADRPGTQSRIVLWVICALIAILIVWASIAKLDIVAVAQGRLVPKTYVKIVQPAEAGVIREILVKEGDAVEEGQVLVRLDPTVNTIDSTAISRELALERLQLRRIESELAGSPMKRELNDRAELFERVEAERRTHHQAFLDSVAQETAARNQSRGELEAARKLRDKLETTLPSYQQSAAAYENLAKHKLVGELAAQEKRREAIEQAQDLKAQSATVTSLEAAVVAHTQRLAQLHSTYAADLNRSRIETVTAINKLNQQLGKLNYQEKLLELRAPQAGVVQNLATTTIGAVVQPGTVLINLVPQDEPLVAEVMIQNQDIGFVEPAQLVRIKVAAYQFQRYGTVDGVVATVSANSSQPTGRQRGGTDAPRSPAFKALIHLKAQQLEAHGLELPLAAGMQVTAEILQGKRTVLEYLLSPVQRVVSEAGMER